MTIAPPGGKPEDDRPGWHPTKYPSTDRMAILPSAGKQPDMALEVAAAEVDR